MRISYNKTNWYFILARRLTEKENEKLVRGFKSGMTVKRRPDGTKCCYKQTAKAKAKVKVTKSKVVALPCTNDSCVAKNSPSIKTFSFS